jgi:hypothetical protein
MLVVTLPSNRDRAGAYLRRQLQEGRLGPGALLPAEPELGTPQARPAPELRILPAGALVQPEPELALIQNL